MDLTTNITTALRTCRTIYTSRRARYLGALFLSTGISGALLLSFYHIPFFPHDDGAFGYLAERIAQGARLGVEVVDFHPGYHALLNGLLFYLLDADVVVLRYPLVGLGILLSGLVTHLLRRGSLPLAVLGGVASAMLGYLQFTNPSSNWYSLVFAIGIVYCMLEHRPSVRRHVAIGILLGLIFMFRHPNAIFLGIGVLGALVVEYALYRPGTTRYDVWITRGVLWLLAGMLILYNIVQFDMVAFVLFGVWPIMALVFLSWRHVASARALRDAIIPIVGGGALVVAPMLVYQLVAGDIVTWFTNAFFGGVRISQLPFFETKSYLSLPGDALRTFFTEGGVYWLQYGIYWILLLSIPVVAGMTTLCMIFRQRDTDTRRLALLLIATSYGYVSYYYQIPFYFFISIPLYILALLYTLHLSRSLKNTFITLTFMYLLALSGTLTGSAVSSGLSYARFYTDTGIPGVSLRIQKKRLETYMPIIEVIMQYVERGDEIFVFPYEPDIYVTTGTHTRFPSPGTIFGVTSEETLRAHTQALIDDPPTLIVYNADERTLREYDERLYTSLIDSGMFTYATTVEPFIYLVPLVREKSDTDTRHNLTPEPRMRQ